MKKIIHWLAASLFVLTASAQEELHIHQVNIENGDATLIGIYDAAQQKYTSKILIDGGQSSADAMLLPYITKMIGNTAESFHFDYVILTHYHDDHYKGLLALKDGLITADSIIDPGGYKVSTYFMHTGPTSTRPDSMKLAVSWLKAIKAASHHNPPFVKGRSKMMIRFSTTATSSIGRKIILGHVGANPVELKCIAGWGNTLSANGQIEPNPSPEKSNANNFTLAFVLSCGEFRYFIGGDMGGSGGQYIDQETTVTEYLNDEYPVSKPSDGGAAVMGHVCGFKANHHGSKNSNNTAFMQGMRPAIVMSSGGNKASWHLPNPQYIQRLATVVPLSVSGNLANGFFNKGVYFTNLYDFNNSFLSVTTANTEFDNKPGVSYNFGNDTGSAKDSYLIKVTDAASLGQKSVFESGRVDITANVPYQRIAFFTCHIK